MDEPVDLRRSTQADEVLSLIIRGEDEAAPRDAAAAGEDGLTNGHGEDESEAGVDQGVPGVRSPGISYWSITEGPNHPLLLSPDPGPGPARRKPRVKRASRTGLSRIPGRDHRRYYHEYWRSEYLMDFDPQRHGMICMVCGSSLATLKLSTIKRHIRQKHPDSLLWSAADKEVIRSGWESHLSLGGGQRSYSSAAARSSPLGEAEQVDSDLHAAEEPDTPEEPPVSPSAHLEVAEVPQLQQEEEEQNLPGHLTRTLERYLNDSLHAWFRQEFLMKYEAEAGRLVCMVCGGELPSLHLDHIKSHVLDTHPNSLVYSSEEKHCILQAWAQTHEDSDNLINSEPNTKEAGVDHFDQDMETIQTNTDSYPDADGTLTQDTCLIGEDGGVGTPQVPQTIRQPRKRRLRGGNPWRLRLDYLVAYGPQCQGTFCMVCSQVLLETKVSSIRRHIQECHPETTTLSREEREAMAAAWTKDYPSVGLQSPDETSLNKAAGVTNEDTSPDVTTASKTVKEELGSGGAGKAGAAMPSRHSHYPGKDERRNYQVRWLMEYLMDYDCLRHGLICTVCGATLATLKVSTIKRHIQQVHPQSLNYSPAEKQQVLASYNQKARQPSSPPQNPGLTERAQSPPP
ncbi:uncharacterized protein C11orf95 homolog isoform X2 [Thalassophryne amazonica]|uniref:uncharacterized protein C11orf95 homolog isoform X2 n=1 Tax=Thalassophryne amazonica TaxID=390379 RepID=UPI0014710DB4|nr:uncharacterized protein C11orf95 homolog isoform X2 [Thalassophryne amazonica]